MRGKCRIVVIGGSTGSLAALKVLLTALPGELNAAVFIVTHIGAFPSVLPEILVRFTALPVRHASDGDPIVPGQILVAPPDHHLLLNADGTVSLSHGPHENYARPAIDPLFRSAALAHGPVVLGVILSGQMDDGSAGLAAIKQCGGLALVQDPANADAAEMPANAIANTATDAVLPAAALGAKIAEIAATPLPSVLPQQEIPQAAEHELLVEGPDMHKLEAISHASTLTCPECHGTLWEVADRPPLRYRCHTGHAYTATILAALQTDVAEQALWSAVRSLRERIFLIDRMAEHSTQPEQLRQRQEARAAADALEHILRGSASTARSGNSLQG